MVDRFGRVINYLRVSVTDRCNLCCHYCMPSRDVKFLPDEKVLTDDEIVEAVRVAAGMGVRKVRITGGEPLLRPRLDTLVRRLSGIRGVDDLAMSTNGTFLAEHAESLADAGLDRVNVSLDAIDPERYARITGGGEVGRVLEGIEAARSAGLVPIKLNCVVREDSSEPDAVDVAGLARRRGLGVRFIRQMDLSAGTFAVVGGGTGGDCRQCNRLRLTCDGYVRPCLFSDVAFSLRRLGTVEAMRQAVEGKPEAGDRCTDRWMYTIGG